MPSSSSTSNNRRDRASSRHKSSRSKRHHFSRARTSNPQRTQPPSGAETVVVLHPTVSTNPNHFVTSLHITAYQRPPRSHSLPHNNNDPPKRYKTKPCVNFQRGACYKSDFDCNFVHIYCPKICIDFLKGECLNPLCLKSHDFSQQIAEYHRARRIHEPTRAVRSQSPTTATPYVHRPRSPRLTRAEPRTSGAQHFGPSQSPSAARATAPRPPAATTNAVNVFSPTSPNDNAVDAALTDLENRVGLTAADLAELGEEDFNALSRDCAWSIEVKLGIKKRVAAHRNEHDDAERAKRLRAKTQPCLDFLAGKCSRGKACWFLHEKEVKESSKSMREWQDMMRRMDERAEREGDLEFQSIEEIKQKFSAKGTDETFIKETRNADASSLKQVCFVVDVTGSMRTCINNVKDNIKSLAKKLEDASGIRASFGLVEYRDYDDKVPLNRHDFGTADQLEAILAGIRVCGGGDAAEDCFGGLHAAMSEAGDVLKWTSPARQIIWIGDAPNHGSRYNGGVDDSYKDCPLVHDGRSLAALAASKCIRIDFVPLNKCTEPMIKALKEDFTDSGAELCTDHPILKDSSSDLIECISRGLMLSAGRSHASLKYRTKTFAPSAGRPTEKPDVKVVPISSIEEAVDFRAPKLKMSVFTPKPQPVDAGRHDNPVAALISRMPPMHKESRSLELMAAPFAQGQLRYAYYCRLGSSDENVFASWSVAGHEGKWIAKTPIYGDPDYALGFTQVIMQNTARFVAEEFNANLAAALVSNPSDAPTPFQVRYIPVQLAAENVNALADYWLLEPPLQGKFLKFNNNAGFVDKQLARMHPALQAFSHFSFEYSDRMLLVCDIQGVVDEGKKEYILTDPAIHTFDLAEVLPDPCNRGIEGMAHFFRTHVCNEYCKLLKLRVRDGREEKLIYPPKCVGKGEMIARHANTLE